MKKLGDVVDNEVVKNKKSQHTLGKKVKNLEKKASDTATWIHINQYNTDKQKFEKKIWNKIPDHAKYITNQEFNKLTAGNFVSRSTLVLILN